MGIRRTSVVHILLAICFAFTASAETSPAGSGLPSLGWEKVFDANSLTGGGAYDVMNDVAPTGEGGAVAAGYSIPPGSHVPGGPPQQAFIVRFDGIGAELWRVLLGDGSDGYEARRIRRTADGGFVVACTAWTPFGTAPAGIYYNTSFVAGIDGNGTELWRYRFDPLAMDLLGDIDVAPDGSIVAAGRVWTHGGGTSMAVAKFSRSGSLLWLRKVAPDYIDGVSNVMSAADGGFFATSAGGYGLTLSRYASDGSILWSAPVADLDGEFHLNEKEVHGLAATADGGCVVIGARRTILGSAYGPFQPFTATFDGRGRQSATVVAFTDSVWVHAVERLSGGGLVAAEGVSGSDTGITYVRYDAEGKELWRSPYGTVPGPVYISAIRETETGGLVAAGAVEENVRWGPLDGYVLMLDGDRGSSGNEVTARIDVLPGSGANPVNRESRGLLPVALLSDPGFDATMADPATITLEDAPVATKGNGGFHAVRKDVDGDGRADLLLFFPVHALGLAPDATTLTMRGTATGGIPFTGSDRIRVVGPHHQSRSRFK